MVEVDPELDMLDLSNDKFFTKLLAYKESILCKKKNGGLLMLTKVRIYLKLRGVFGKS